MSECVKCSLQERSGRDLSGDEGTGWAINTQWQGGVSESLLRDDFSIPSFFDSSFFYSSSTSFSLFSSYCLPSLGAIDST